MKRKSLLRNAGLILNIQRGKVMYSVLGIGKPSSWLKTYTFDTLPVARKGITLLTVRLLPRRPATMKIIRLLPDENTDDADFTDEHRFEKLLSNPNCYEL